MDMDIMNTMDATMRTEGVREKLKLVRKVWVVLFIVNVILTSTFIVLVLSPLRDPEFLRQVITTAQAFSDEYGDSEMHSAVAKAKVYLDDYEYDISTIVGYIRTFTLVTVLASLAVVFAISLLLFWQLLKIQDWARILIIIFSWLGSINCIFGGISLFGSLPFVNVVLARFPNEFATLVKPFIIPTLAINGAVCVVGLIFCVFAIKTLQFDPEVKDVFKNAEL